VLDGKAAQNILILLNGTLKHTSYEEVKTCLLRCEGPVINDNILQGLIQYLPPPDQLTKLQNFKDQYDDLTEAEQFCVTVSFPPCIINNTNNNINILYFAIFNVLSSL
jgi:diaphanous protein